MKKFLTKFLPWIILAAMFIVLIPSLKLRIDSEKDNKNVTVSLLYNDIVQKVSKNKLDEVLDECLDIGVDVITLTEEDINAYINRGDVTSIKYNVLRHKYDDESLRVAQFIEDNCPEIAYDSHIIMVKKDENNFKSNFRKAVSQRYSKEQMVYLGESERMDIYVYFDGRTGLYEVTVGYDENVIKELDKKGFRIALSLRVKNFDKTEYLDEIDRLVKTYNIDFLGIKPDTRQYDKEDINQKNYENISKIINENNLTLVVTENPDQLSNQTTIGYADIFEDVLGKDGTGKVVRAFETYDDYSVDDTNYKYRVTQYLNSTIDRNARFIVGTQIAVRGTHALTYDDCADLTLKALKDYKTAIEEQGFTVNGEPASYDYNANRRLIGASAAVIMIMAVLIMFSFVIRKWYLSVNILFYILSAAAFIMTLTVMPMSLIKLYSSVYCIIMSCFTMTMVICFADKMKEKLSSIPLAISTLLVTLACLIIGSIGLASLLSGIDYYINNEIFRGIKFSLTVPPIYTAVIFFFMFMRTRKINTFDVVRKLLFSEIKLYWIIIAAGILGVGYYYILRSGNVNTISSLEQQMRTALTNLFTVRPRTKEFLIGYPALILFVYYMKNINIRFFQWLLAIAASILTASVTNSFCHVFTDYTVIVTRTINGLIVGIVVSVFAYVINLVLVKFVRYAYKFILSKLETK